MCNGTKQRKYDGKCRGVMKMLCLALLLIGVATAMAACRAVDNTEDAIESGIDSMDGTNQENTTGTGDYNESETDINNGTANGNSINDGNNNAGNGSEYNNGDNGTINGAADNNTTINGTENNNGTAGSGTNASNGVLDGTENSTLQETDGTAR